MQTRGISTDITMTIRENAAVAARDWGFLETIHFSPGVISYAMGALSAGFNIVCDTVTIKNRLHKMPMMKLGITAHCFEQDKTAARQLRSERAVFAIEEACSLNRPLIFVIGSMPQSLVTLNELTAAKVLMPKLVIATPIGYSDAVESKKALLESGVPAIISQGMKGGSDAAVAIANTLLDLAAPSRIKV